MNIILAGCGKNIENNIDILKKNYNNFKNHNDINICNVIIYENNSIDNTPNILKLWEKSNNDIVCICENYTNDELLNICKARTWDNIPCRMEIIAMARNKILEEQKKNKYSHIHYLIMYDLDITKVLPYENIIDILKNKNYEFDALICKGTDKKGEIYDTFAYKDDKYYIGEEHGNENYVQIQKQNIKKFVNSNKNDLIPVLSAFNAMCIFNKKSIKDCKYSAIPNKELDDFYRKKNYIKNINTHYNGALMGVYLHGTDGMFYHNCSGYNFPVICEHVNFFMEMRKNGNNNIYICTKLLWDNLWN